MKSTVPSWRGIVSLSSLFRFGKKVKSREAPNDTKVWFYQGRFSVFLFYKFSFKSYLNKSEPTGQFRPHHRHEIPYCGYRQRTYWLEQNCILCFWYSPLLVWFFEAQVSEKYSYFQFSRICLPMAVFRAFSSNRYILRPHRHKLQPYEVHCTLFRRP